MQIGKQKTKHRGIEMAVCETGEYKNNTREIYSTKIILQNYGGEGRERG